MARKLRLLWSPEQIAGWLKRTYPGEERCHVSHETIYRGLTACISFAISLTIVLQFFDSRGRPRRLPVWRDLKRLVNGGFRNQSIDTRRVGTAPA